MLWLRGRGRWEAIPRFILAPRQEMWVNTAAPVVLCTQQAPVLGRQWASWEPTSATEFYSADVAIARRCLNSVQVRLRPGTHTDAALAAWVSLRRAARCAVQMLCDLLPTAHAPHSHFLFTAAASTSTNPTPLSPPQTPQPLTVRRQDFAAMVDAGEMCRASDVRVQVADGVEWVDVHGSRVDDEGARHALQTLIGALALGAGPCWHGIPSGHLIAFNAPLPMILAFVRHLHDEAELLLAR